jgi:alpha-beta hydrolase superfamily lysophospholipase
MRVATPPRPRAFLLGLLLLALGGCNEDGAIPSSATPAPSDAGATRVEFATADGALLHGRLWPASTERLVILLHMYGADQASWYETARALQRSGASALTFDFRGFGESEGARDTALLVVDVTGALAFARAQHYDEVVLIGASMGGTAALIAAGAPSTPDLVRGVVALSAPVEFGGLSATEAASAIEVPVLLLASRDDPSAYESGEELASTMGLTSEGWAVQPGGGHGTSLLEGASRQGALERMGAFLRSIWPEVRLDLGVAVP